MTTYTIKTSGGWTYTGVSEWELKRKLREIAERGEDIVGMTTDSGTPVRYNLNTVYFGEDRDKIKVLIAKKDAKVREELRRKAAELARKYEEIAKSYDADMKNYPKAAAGLKKSQEEYYRKAAELRAFAEGKGDVPEWFAKMFVTEVTPGQLKEIGYDVAHPTHLTFSADKEGVPENPRVRSLIEKNAPDDIPIEKLRPTGLLVTKKKLTLAPQPKEAQVMTMSGSKRKIDMKKLALIAVGALAAGFLLKKLIR